MKSILVVLLLWTIPAAAQNPLWGPWSGKLMGMTIVLHFVPRPDGSTAATLEIPLQGVAGTAFTEVRVSPDSIACTLEAAHVGYRGTRAGDTLIKGFWIQGTARIPLDMRPTLDTAWAAERPQTPHPPYPYNSDSVTYDNADHTVQFGATLTWPKTGKACPAILLITGSGTQDRDETILGHKPFAVIADYLTRRGYAVLRVDDRGAGLTRGDAQSATVADLAKDVEAGLAYLKTRREINPHRLGLLGHSEGAMVAPMVAARDKDVRFIVLLASPAVGGLQTIVWQSVEPLKRAGEPKALVEGSATLEKTILEAAMATADSSVFMARVSPAYRTWYASAPDSLRTRYSAQYQSPDAFLSQLRYQTPILLSPGYRFFLSYSPLPDFRRLTCPVLALDGEQDVQVDCKTNLDLIQKTLTEAGNRHFETKALPGLNHLFQHCRTCTVQEYIQLKETISPGALQLIGDWLDENAGH